MDDDEGAKNLPASVDMGPCQLQTLSGLQDDTHDACEIESVLGVLPSLAPQLPKEKDEQVVNTLNDGLNLHNKKNHTTIQFPYASPTPINEYDEENSLFTRAFPWLFPGGLGDFGQFQRKKQMLLIGQGTCFIIKMGGLQRIGYGVFLHWIMQQGKKPNEWWILCRWFL